MSEEHNDEVQPKETVFEQLYIVLYEYRFSRIGFLELLEKWKEILRIPPPIQE